jgi:leucyl aminopeptidase
MKIKKAKKIAGKGCVLVLCREDAVPEAPGLLSEGRALLEDKPRKAFDSFSYQQLDRLYHFAFYPAKSLDNKALEKARLSGLKALQLCRENSMQELSICVNDVHKDLSLAALEGVLLGDYKFDKYKSKKKPAKPSEISITFTDERWNESGLRELQNTVSAVVLCRDLVNEPQNHLTATRLSKEIVKAGKDAGFKVEVFNKKKIEALKMGGILAVNQGSIEPPTFSIMEYKPAKPVNKAPLILIGKGVVYDTGGLSLKPTPASMDMMKCDMAGAAMMLGAISAIAANKLPVHVIALVPSTDNRPGLNAYAPGDIITMYDGTTVEVRNTDAEGRLLLADALAYAKKYKPELVIESSTLTGAAIRAVGTLAIAGMSTADEKVMHNLKASGNQTWERIIEFPLWEEYGEEMKSEIADLNNLGGAYAGQITAGKFLEHFTDYPFVHLDIAGPAFLTSKHGYQPAGGTGIGVRLLYDFVKRHYKV